MYLDGQEVKVGQRNLLIVEVFAEALTEDDNVFDFRDFRLLGPDGRAIETVSMHQLDSASPAELRLAPRTGEGGRLLFYTPDLITDLSGYTLVLSRDSHLPGYLPFDGALPEPYPIALEVGATGTAIAPTTSADCFDTWETEVTAASLELEGGEFARVTRTPTETRLLIVEMAVFNATFVDDDVFCEIATGQLLYVNFRLSIDGRPIGPKYNAVSDSKVNAQTTGTRTISFEIPVDAGEVTLLGPRDEDIIAVWTLEPPLMPGQEGAA